MSAPTLTNDRVVVTDDGARLAVTVHGSGGTTVVLSHGWAAGRDVWSSVVPLLVAQGNTVVTYDQRGHAGSTLGSTPIGIARLAADLDAVLSSVDATDAVVVGHSGGGFAALQLVVKGTSRVRGLVLLSTAANDQDTPESEVKLMGNPVFAWAFRRGPLGRKMLGSTVGPTISKQNLEAHRVLFAGTARQVRAACFKSSQGMDLRADLANVTLPAVVLHGDVDKVIDSSLGKVLAGTLPNARFDRLTGIGHMLPLEAPERVADAVAELA
ncbi:alpha/beta fold hydrolase [Actinocrispum wychmicini]|uniref:Pimeloyl-ACP methyl ester carboxylesterase n=1 Tax=Actinocrispum wychmicini TaxID=1213861 RepID=A0A4R2JF14_9PSEU|nr:alpha/beta hydrolase [Actinocrispum wychmicini]TCO52815.1 pimeloyl-ACP methyl ester carboxylesterase [Actinocrispum wychmicini]